MRRRWWRWWCDRTHSARAHFPLPLLPPNGYEGRKLKVHVQDEVGHVSSAGNLFLTNMHREFEGDTHAPSFEDEDTTDYFLGNRNRRRPAAFTSASARRSTI
jgi:hypothetical protein